MKNFEIFPDNQMSRNLLIVNNISGIFFISISVFSYLMICFKNILLQLKFFLSFYLVSCFTPIWPFKSFCRLSKPKKTSSLTQYTTYLQKKVKSLVSVQNWPKLLPEDKNAITIRLYMLLCMREPHSYWLYYLLATN